MAITESAKKSIRQSATRREQNFVYRDNIKAVIKEARALVLDKKMDEAKELETRQTNNKIDRIDAFKNFFIALNTLPR